ncbi:MAG TPA: DUF4288 domain-containing protein [Nitrospirota bacterium]
MSNWFAATTVEYLKNKEGKQEAFFLWESVLLFEAETAEEVRDKAIARSKVSGREGNDWELDGQPAEWHFAGVRSIVPLKDRPGDGSGVISMPVSLKSEEDLESFIEGNDANALRYTEEPFDFRLPENSGLRGPKEQKISDWSAAHLIFYIQFKDEEVRQEGFPAWEKVILINDTGYIDPFIKAEEIGIMLEDDNLVVDGKEAYLMFAGVRKITACADGEDQPGDGTELTYTDMELESEDDIKAFASGQAIEILYHAIEPEEGADNA